MVTIHQNMQVLAILVAGPTPRSTYSPSLMERKSCPTFSTTWPEHDLARKRHTSCRRGIDLQKRKSTLMSLQGDPGFSPKALTPYVCPSPAEHCGPRPGEARSSSLEV